MIINAFGSNVLHIGNCQIAHDAIVRGEGGQARKFLAEMTVAKRGKV